MTAETTTAETTTKITLDQADELVLASEYGDRVEECEENEAGYVYTLEDGSAVVVTFDGRLIGEGQTVPAMSMAEQIAFDAALTDEAQDAPVTACPCCGTGVYPYDDEDDEEPSECVSCGAPTFGFRVCHLCELAGE